jgi:hypothetical protein
MDSDESQPTTLSEESKRKFLEALERKKQQGASRSGVGGADSGVHGVHTRAGGKREFRRKSGG